MAESQIPDELIILIDEDGQESEFLLVDSLELGGKKYAAIVPMEAIWMRVDLDESGNEVFAPLTDDENEAVLDELSLIEHQADGDEDEPEPEASQA